MIKKDACINTQTVSPVHRPKRETRGGFECPGPTLRYTYRCEGHL